MKYKTALLAKILVLAVVFAFSACQKGAAENSAVSFSPVISPPMPQATPTPDSALRKIDFKNFTYPWPEGLGSGEKSFALKNGERVFVMGGQMGVSLAKAEYADVTGDGREEAFLDLSIQTGGSAMPSMIYVYSLENEKPRLLWSFVTGDRAAGGFKKIYAENGELIVETFGDNKFENNEWKFDYPKDKFRGDCCPTAYTKIRFKWNGRKFVAGATPEVFDFDRENQGKEN